MNNPIRTVDFWFRIAAERGARIAQLESALASMTALVNAQTETARAATVREANLLAALTAATIEAARAAVQP